MPTGPFRGARFACAGHGALGVRGAQVAGCVGGGASCVQVVGCTGRVGRGGCTGRVARAGFAQVADRAWGSRRRRPPAWIAHPVVSPITVETSLIEPCSRGLAAPVGLATQPVLNLILTWPSGLLAGRLRMALVPCLSRRPGGCCHRRSAAAIPADRNLPGASRATAE